MSSLANQLEVEAGGAVLRALTHVGRRLMRVKERVYVDHLGRSSPYLELGEGRRGELVWLHGFSDRRDTFLPVARALVDDYRVLIPAMPAFDVGPFDPLRQHDLRSYRDFAAGFIEREANGPVHLVGNSLGGGTAILVAATAPELVRSLAPVDALAVELEDIASVISEFARGEFLFACRSYDDYLTFEQRIFARPPKAPGFVRRHLAADFMTKADWYERVGEDLRLSERYPRGPLAATFAELDAIVAPTLVVWGELDTLFPLAHGRYLAEGIAGAELEVMKGVGHCPHLEQPRALARLLRAFFDRR
jgi:pimeloyl-ACP methyl ester carboxylesterase